jgi:hypothetical protein
MTDTNTNTNTNTTDQQALADWLESHLDQLLSVWAYGPVGGGCESYATDRLVLDGEAIGDLPDVTNVLVDVDGDEIAFCLGHRSFRVRAISSPTDRWGSMATFAGGIDPADGVESIWYEDDQISERGDHLYSALLELDDEEAESVKLAEFVEWLEEHVPAHVSEVGEEVTCCGTANSWRYVTTDLSIDRLACALRQFARGEDYAPSAEEVLELAGDLREAAPRADASAVVEWRDAGGKIWRLPGYALRVAGRVVLWTLTDEAGVQDIMVSEEADDLDAKIAEYVVEIASSLGDSVDDA